MGLLHRAATSLWLSLQGEGPHWGTLSQLGGEVSGLTYSGAFIGPGCSFCLHQDSISGKPLGRLCLRDPPEQHIRYD